MKYKLLLLTIGIILIVIPLINTQPSFNGSAPGCSDSGCHTLQDGIVSASVNGFQVEITVNNTTSTVAGELVDTTGTVVAVNNGTSSNPFTLNAPGPGLYRVNAGFRSPSPRRWDSTMVEIIITGISENQSTPDGYKLFANFPNPFNPSTVIKYSIPVAGFTSLKVYNTIGEKVATLVNEVKSAGTFEVNFNAQDLPSGIYFYTLNAGQFSETKKMILIK